MLARHTPTLALLGVVTAAAFVAARKSRYQFRGRVVLITGGSRGLGLELARECVARGAAVALTARSSTELAAAVDHLSSLGGKVFTYPADLSQSNQVARAVEATVAHYGRIDVLVNNAGVVQVGPMADMTADDYEASLAVHFWAPYHATEAVVPVMRRQGGGRIVNVSSIGGKVAVPHMAPYSVGKFALVGYSDACRSELARDGIVVTTVCPGLMRTGSSEKAWVKGRHEAESTWFLIAASLPVLAIHSRRAARQILDACAAARASLILTPQARMTVVAQALAPESAAALRSLVARLLPGPAGPAGRIGRSGRDARPRTIPAWLVRAGDRAARRNLELLEAPMPPSTAHS